MNVYVIAEAGSCHDGDFVRALALVKVAADAGASAIKFQYWSDSSELADRRRVPDRYREIYARYAMSKTWLIPLASQAREHGLDFMCSTYLPQDVSVVAPFVQHFKIASFEAEASDLVYAHLAPMSVSPEKNLIVSLGMGTSLRGEDVLRCAGIGRPRLRFLRCVSAYPAPAASLRLFTLARDRAGVHWDKYDGLSDHTAPELTWTGALAVAAGAKIVEAHLRLDETDENNPDAPHAMRPHQFAEYVANVKFASTCYGIGDSIVGPEPSEREMAQYKVSR